MPIGAAAPEVVAITGGAGDIGRAIARAWSVRGARVALLDLPGPRLDAAVAEIPGARAFPGDITDPEAVQRAIDGVLTAFGRLDALVLSAGATHRSAFEQTDLAVIRRVMDVNFYGAVHATRAALPALRRSRGAVVALSSVAGFAPLVGRAAYAASKHALHGFFGSLRTEVARDGVRVVLVCPSFVDTGFAGRAMDGAGGLLSGPRAVAGRPLTADQVAAAVVDAATRGQRLRLVSPVAHASLWLSRLAPGLYDRVMRRSQRSEFG